MAAAEAAKEAAAEAARYASDSASVGSQKAKETAGAAYDAAGDAAGAAKHKGKKVSAVRAVSIAVRIPDACCCWPESISATADMVKRRLASCSSLQSFAVSHPTRALLDLQKPLALPRDTVAVLRKHLTPPFTPTGSGQHCPVC